MSDYDPDSKFMDLNHMKILAKQVLISTFEYIKYMGYRLVIKTL